MSNYFDQIWTPHCRGKNKKLRICVRWKKKRKFGASHFRPKFRKARIEPNFFRNRLKTFFLFVPVMKSFSSVFSRVSDRPVEKPPELTGSFKLNKAENVSQFAKVAFPSKSSHQLWLTCEQALAYLSTFIQCQVSHCSCSTTVERPSKVVDNSATLLTWVWTPAAA